MIWDLHCHPSSFDGGSPERCMTELLRLMDRMGIDRTCIYLSHLRDTDPNPAQLREHNDWILRALGHGQGRAFGFAYVNPNYVDPSLAEINRCVRDGPMVGIKLWVARRCSDPVIDPIIAAAASLEAAIFQHTWMKTGGNLPGESTPVDLAALAARFPRVHFICGHTGGNWWHGLRAVRALPNVSLDLAGSDPVNGFTEMCVREAGAARVLYGSDAGGRSLASQLAKVQGARISEADRRLIYGANLQRLLTPILRRKGVRLL